MKAARLHDGELMEFPDQTSDEAIDEAVLKRMQEKVQENAQAEHETATRQKKEKEEDERRTSATVKQSRELHDDGMNYKRQRHAQEDARGQQWRHEDMTRQGFYHAQKMHMGDQTHQLLMEVLSKVGEITQALKTVTESTTHMQEAVVQMAQAVTESAQTVSQAILAPKELTFDGRGRPTGVKRAGVKKETMQ